MKSGPSWFIFACCAPSAIGATPPPRHPPAPRAEITVTQITIQQSVVVRVQNRAAPPKPLRWKDRKGPKCVAMATIAGAAVVADDAIDLAIRGGQRMRAHFSSRCPALDYYSGFYVLPTDDGQICADRDVIRTRSGGQCEIQRFRILVPRD